MAENNEPSVNANANDENEITDDDLENFTCPHLPLPNGIPNNSSSDPQPSTSNNGSPNPSSPSQNTGQGNNGGAEGSDSGPDAAEIAGTVVKTAGVAAGTAVVGTTAATAGLSAVGFSSGGIVGGSIAAGMQAGIGNVAAGSTFAMFQSIGATGGFAILGPVGLALGAVGGLSYGGYKLAQYLKEKNRRDNERPPDKFVKYELVVAEPKENPPEESKDTKKDSKKKGEPVPLVRGVNICDECWLQLQIRLYNRYSRNRGALYNPD